MGTMLTSISLFLLLQTSGVSSHSMEPIAKCHSICNTLYNHDEVAGLASTAPPHKHECPPLMTPQNTQMETHQEDDVTIVSYQCISSEYSLTGTNTRTCVNGKWIPKEEPQCLEGDEEPSTTQEPSTPPRSCNQPTHPVNGFVVPYVDKWFEYKCNEGYQLIGLARYVHCEHPRTPPICQQISTTAPTMITTMMMAIAPQKSCPPPQSPVNGNVDFSSLSGDSIAVFSCRRGYHFNRNRQSIVATCLQSTWSWSEQPTTCSRIQPPTTTFPFQGPIAPTAAPSNDQTAPCLTKAEADCEIDRCDFLTMSEDKKACFRRIWASPVCMMTNLLGKIMIDSLMAQEETSEMLGKVFKTGDTPHNYLLMTCSAAHCQLSDCGISMTKPCSGTDEQLRSDCVKRIFEHSSCEILRVGIRTGVEAMKEGMPGTITASAPLHEQFVEMCGLVRIAEALTGGGDAAPLVKSRAKNLFEIHLPSFLGT